MPSRGEMNFALNGTYLLSSINSKHIFNCQRATSILSTVSAFTCRTLARNLFNGFAISLFLISITHFSDQCGKCRAGSRRLNLNKYCKRDYGNSSVYSSILLIRQYLTSPRFSFVRWKYSKVCDTFYDKKSSTRIYASVIRRGIFLSSLSIILFICLAILGKIYEKEAVKDWIKFTINVQSIYKRNRDSKLRRGSTFVWIHESDLSCKCPKIKTGK